MTWQIDLALRGDLQRFMDAEVKTGKQAVTTIIRRRTTALKNNLRKQVARAGLGSRLGNAIRGNAYPRRGSSLDAAGVVKSNALVKRNRRVTDLVTLFDEGGIIFPIAGKKFLAIANPAVVQRGPGVKGRPRARSPSEFPKGSFIFRPTTQARLALLVKRNDPTKVAFWLVKLVRIPKKLDINKAYLKAIRGLDAAVAKQWERNSAKTQSRFDINL